MCQCLCDAVGGCLRASVCVTHQVDVDTSVSVVRQVDVDVSLSV